MTTRLPEILRKHQQTLLSEWIAELKNALGRRLIKEGEIEEQCAAFFRALEQGASRGAQSNLDDPAWGDMKELLASVSRSRSLAGYSPSETAMFVFSFKRPLFAKMSKDLPTAELAEELWNATLLLDQLGLSTTE